MTEMDTKKRNEEIYNLFKNGVKRADIASQYHVSMSNISGIIHGEEYKKNCPDEMRRMLSQGTYSAIKKFGIKDFEELKEWCKSNDLCDIKYIGKKRKAEIISALF